MAENFPGNNSAEEHHDHHDSLLKRQERLKEDLILLRLKGSGIIHEIGEDARAVSGMAKMTFGMPTLNPVVVSDDDDEDDTLTTDTA